MSSKIIAMGLCGAILVGCGGSGSSNHELNEYTVSDFDGRVVSEDTLAGTWVAVGSGVDDFQGIEGGRGEKRFVLKEYFVISGDVDSGFKKHSCSKFAEFDISVNETAIEFDEFSGIVTDNKMISGQSFHEDNYQDEETEVNYYSSETINFTALKISDATSSFARISVNDGSGEQSQDLFCYRQFNGYFDYNNWDVNFVEIETIFGSMAENKGSFANISIYISTGGIENDFHTDDEGHSVSFELITDSSLSETVTFSAFDNSDSVTGTITVQLPAE